MGALNIILVAGLLPGLALGSYIIRLDPTKERKPLKHFWESTGLCPPLPHNSSEAYFLGKDQRLNLAYISSVPNGGIKQVRIHWLLDLITLKGNVVNEIPQYNFTKLDELMDLLMENDLVPGFELMGNPSGYFTDFEDKVQVKEWRYLIYSIAKRYIEKYGLSHVSSWNFETWNEPDHHDFDNVSVTVTGFQNYYDACSEGLKQASPLLKFGGPGDSCRPRAPICWGLLSHCFNGTNFFTQETGVRLDYIALHKKGGGSSLHILEQEIDTVSEIQRLFPKFKSVPIYNDEADPLVGWSTPQSWRGDVTYGAMVVKVIDEHIDYMLSNESQAMNYSLLSNDNAFMNYYPHYFTQRTLTARFQMNNTKPPHVQMVRKPVLTVMGLLALLGEVHISAQIYLDSDMSINNSIIGVIASTHNPERGIQSDSWQSTILLYASDDNKTSTDIQFLTLNFTNFPNSKDLVYVTYYIDNTLTNPFSEYQKVGSPDFPTIKEFKQMHDAEDPIMDGPTTFPKEGDMILKVKLPVPSVLLIHICEKPNSPPGTVTHVRIIPLFRGQVSVVWSDEQVLSRCLKTYEVEFSFDGVTFSQINTRQIIFTLFTYSPDTAIVSGYYRVRAVNFWNIPGPYSVPVMY
ncbi:PREDICTED: alpha-L-iduronidase [Nanorana parkeri]|uniref:alpha-L-iduronidase n=1 Tax=Nanorana parkeri TaxID=125878 RepID=UPI00085489F4|nr:PREDICTED: alpha-L-iduronidase [Nanorana parkeri]